jgi:hypothetical protein
LADCPEGGPHSLRQNRRRDPYLFHVAPALAISGPGNVVAPLRDALHRYGALILNPDLDILDASWALDNPTAEAEFGYLSVRQTAVVGKQILGAYYGTGPSLSYFDGCSNGGRQALEEVQRYPTDFNGVVAGAPVLDLTGLMIQYTWDMKALHATVTSSDIPAEKLPVIGNAVVAECDAIDGLVDGQIDDPRRCHFDPDTLLCPGADAPNCLTAVQVAALKQIYAGARRSSRQTSGARRRLRRARLRSLSSLGRRGSRGERGFG